MLMDDGIVGDGDEMVDGIENDSEWAGETPDFSPRTNNLFELLEEDHVDDDNDEEELEGRDGSSSSALSLMAMMKCSGSTRSSIEKIIGPMVKSPMNSNAIGLSVGVERFVHQVRLCSLEFEELNDRRD
jgi:hypothetical protein